MRIRSVETLPVEVPVNPRRAIRSSLKLTATNRFLFVKLHTDEGITGLGEVSCDPVWSGEDQVTAAHYVERLFAPLIAGEDPSRIERISAKLDAALKGNPFTKAGIEMALWDILGKVAGLPLYRLLGGAVRDVVPTKFSVSGAEPKQAAEIAEWAASAGFRAMKVKVGLDPDADVERVRAVRQAIGPKLRLGVDANGGWSPRVAIQTIRRLYPFDIAFVEQPVPALDVAWLAEVRRHVELPILADESVFSLQDAMAVARAGAADALSAYVGKGGGIGPARKVAAVAEAAGLGCTLGSNLELGVASAAMIHLAMATSGIRAEELPCDIIGPLYYDEDLLVERLPIHGGEARPLERPGLGVELDEGKIARFRLR